MQQHDDTQSVPINGLYRSGGAYPTASAAALSTQHSNLMFGKPLSPFSGPVSPGQVSSVLLYSFFIVVFIGLFKSLYHYILTLMMKYNLIF